MGVDARVVWGVEFDSWRGTPTLLWRGWHEAAAPAYPGEPTRPLVFETRALARAWCREKQATFAGRTDACAAWRFRPVKLIAQYRRASGT